MRYTSAGESHGPAITAIVSDVVAGIEVDSERIDRDLARRQVGYGRGGRMRIETDRVAIESGVRFGRTLGTPITLRVENRDATNWLDRMAAGGEKPEEIREVHPRPGHADLVGSWRIGTDDVRDVLERASARETVARVASGAVAKAMLAQLGVEIRSFVRRIGAVELEMDDPAAVDFAAADASDVRCPDEGVAARMREGIDAAQAAGDSLGGVFTIVVTGLIPGLGGYAEADMRLTSRLGGALFSIPAMKGVEFGLGFGTAERPGSAVHDPILLDRGHVVRPTNNAGGLEGGMTTGEPLVVSVAMKPIPTLMRPLPSIDLDTMTPHDASQERSDVVAVPAASIVGEAQVALVLADAYQQMFGSTTMSDMQAAVDAYLKRVPR